MAITHYIDTSLPEIARSRVKSLTNRVTEAFPVLVYGDTRDHNFIFHNAGTVESFSGNGAYSLRVTLGEVSLGPTNGTYSLTCGAATATIPCLADAFTIQAALNGMAQITADGGVTVTGTFPTFLITWNTVGVVTSITGSAALLIPQTGISLTTLQTGTASVVNQVALILRQSAIASQTSWTTITSPANGWTGTLTTNTSGALTLLEFFGKANGDFIEVNTVITVEVLSSSIPISYYQSPVILRAKNLDPGSATTTPIGNYLGAAQIMARIFCRV